MSTSDILTKIKGTEAHIEKLADCVKELEESLTVTVVAAVAEAFQGQEAQEFAKKLVSDPLYLLRFGLMGA